MRHTVDLTFKGSTNQLEFPGDYAWSDLGEGVQQLHLCCPLCGTHSVLPLTTSILSSDPLDIEDDVRCGFCSYAFEVHGDVANCPRPPFVYGSHVQ